MQILDGPHVMNTLDYSVTVTNLNPGLTYSFKVPEKRDTSVSPVNTYTVPLWNPLLARILT